MKVSSVNVTEKYNSARETLSSWVREAKEGEYRGFSIGADVSGHQISLVSNFSYGGYGVTVSMASITLAVKTALENFVNLKFPELGEPSAATL